MLVIESKAPTVDQSGSISLFSTDGKPGAVLPLKPGSAVLAAAGARIFIRAADGSLDALRRDGNVEVLEAVPNTLSGLGGLVASPDGKRWVWGSQTSDTTSQSIYWAGDGLAARKLATFPYATVLEAYAWTGSGIFFDSLPPDSAGYWPFSTTFGAFGGMRRLDANGGTIAIIATPDCSFSDEAPSGWTACFPRLPYNLQPTRHILRIISPAAKITDLSLAVPRFNFVGDAYFSPDGSMLTVAGATGVGDNSPQTGSTNPKPEEYSTDLVQTSDGSIARFGPIGTRPARGTQSWLPDGRLVLWRPDSVGGTPGLYVLDPHGTGQGAEIEVSGKPIGYLTN